MKSIALLKIPSWLAPFRPWSIALVVALSLAAGLHANAATPAAPCTVRPGAGGGMVIVSTVLLPDRAIRDAQVAIDPRGRIACVGLACLARAPRATVVRCPASVLSPGLINTHDHIDYTTDAPHRDTGERYLHRHEWRVGQDGHAELVIPPDRDPRSIAWGELRFLAGGTTSTVAERMAPGLVRNLDFTNGREGLPAPPVVYRIFPLDDARGIVRTADCDYGPHPATRADVVATHAFLAHVAEGRDAVAHNEFRCESSTTYDTTPQPGGGGTSNDWIVPQATLIHAVALTPTDLALVAQRHASIVWSPRSNLALYGATLEVVTARRLGITVALGSDWLPSGSMNLNRELACAAYVDHAYLHDALTSRDLWRMVTLDAARAVHDDAWIGSIAVGKLADLTLFASNGGDPYRAVVASSPQTTQLVLRGGTPLYGDPAIVDRLRAACEPLNVGGSAKRLCPEPGRPSARELVAYARARDIYPLAFAGTPRDEPPCVRSGAPRFARATPASTTP